MKLTKEKLKTFALHTLFEPTSLDIAMQKLKFVQADPIRSPARAQDLVLRHRVTNYRVGDLEKKYEDLGYDEDYLYMYGFMPKEVSSLWHPIKPKALTKFDKQVLETLGNLGPVNPKKLIEVLGNKRVRNWWGGHSQAAKYSLDILHWWGQVRIVRREKGIRIYETRPQLPNGIETGKRQEEIVSVIANLLSPITERKLTEALHRFRKVFGDSKKVVERMIKNGKLTRQNIEGVNYIWPSEKEIPLKPTTGVKFLTPFDPVVWDRNRFEHLWGWQYRFEAYVPKEKRIRGYYAMPLLWNQEIIGWANIKKESNILNAEFGFIKSKPKSKIFKSELAKELDRLKTFLGS